MSLFRHLRTHLIVAPNTSTGKSIFATGLCRASLTLGEHVAYLKPVGTGSGDGDDEAHIRRFAPGAKAACLFHFDEPVSPHLAAQRSIEDGGMATAFPTDDEFAAAIAEHVVAYADEVQTSPSAIYIESAGGVHSPTLSGSSQLDAYRPLLPPTLLVASHELGGISTTISAYESLLIRGYDVDAVLVFREEYYRNFEYFQSWFGERGIRVAVVDRPPPHVVDLKTDRVNLEAYYRRASEDAGAAPLQQVIHSLRVIHEARLAKLKSAPRRSLNSFWYPFCQHSLLKNDSDIMVIDSAHRDFFSVYRDDAPPPPLPSELSAPADATTSLSLTQPLFDGSASWWTQCLGHSHPELTLAAAQASGRYGHIIFPSATSTASLDLAETILATVGKSWASRVFFSDDGSTGMEVGIKMALRAYAERHGLKKDLSGNLAILGLRGSYHGDTIGVMDAADGNVYNERVEWYQGRGLWLDPPTLKIEQGQVVLRSEMGAKIGSYPNLSEAYDVDSRLEKDPLEVVYRQQIDAAIEQHYAKGGNRFGALILEPVVMGAGGMIFVDPLFQRVLVDTVRTNRTLFPDPVEATSSPRSWSGLPVIFDEVFVGLHRLGRPSAATFLGSHTFPDIACYAKILTGGLVPMAVTLATDAIFKAFWRPQKVDALLHGHSYTAHPIGCAIATKTLAILDRMDQTGAWEVSKQDWATSDATSVVEASVSATPVWSLWSTAFTIELSSLPNVDGAMAMGTVLSIYLPAGDAGGYQSTASEAVLKTLRDGKPQEGGPSASLAGLPFNVHARALGNVLYFMSSLNSAPATLRGVEQAILDVLR